MINQDTGFLADKAQLFCSRNDLKLLKFIHFIKSLRFWIKKDDFEVVFCLHFSALVWSDPS